MQLAYQTNDITLLFAELQPMILSGHKTVTQHDLTRAIGAAVDIARALQIPVISSTVPMGPPDMPVEMITEVSDFPPMIRTSVSLLDDEVISATLKSSGRRILALGGVSSEIAILHTSLSASQEGYDVFVLTDCCAGLNPRTEAAAFRQMERAGAQLSSVSSFFTALVPDMNHPHGKIVFSSLARYWGW